MKRKAFDTQKYIELQSAKIMERVAQFDNKLYMEFGGKLFDDNHASRVLPGFEPDIKIKMLLQLKDKVEMLLTVNAGDIEKNKVRGDSGITYSQEIFRLIDAFRGIGLYVNGVVITRYSKQATAEAFIHQLKNLGINYYLHYSIEGYPTDVDHIVSDEGFGLNDYVPTTRPLVVITAPGPGSGKMAVCLSQLYHDSKRNIRSGYAKFETFPVWNLPLKHPVNLAYEAATADLNDVNMIDPFHLEAYGELAINYNRDVESFPVLVALMKKLMGDCPYKSPTDMGVNMVGFSIIDDDAAIAASNDEIIRRYYQSMVRVREGLAEQEEIDKTLLIMNNANITINDRPCVKAALDKAEETNAPAMAIELNDGTIVTGKTSSLFGPASAALLNAIKHIAGIDDEALLIREEVVQPVQVLKTAYLGNNNPRLHSDETLVCLAVSAADDKLAKKAMDCLHELKDTQAHATTIPSIVDQDVYRKLGINLTSEPVYQTKKLFHPK
jgi:uncharacterized protein (UPF0371 family)